MYPLIQIRILVFNTMSDKDSDTDMAECNGHFTPPDGISEEQQGHMQECLKSRRVVQDDDLLRLTKRVRKGDWRQLGNSLKFNFTKLDSLAHSAAHADGTREGTEEQRAEQEEQDAVHKMLLDWVAWKGEKATVGRLAKALFLNQEWEAIQSLNP